MSDIWIVGCIGRGHNFCLQKSRMCVAGWVYFFYNLLALYFFLTQTCFNGNVFYHRLSLQLIQCCIGRGHNFCLQKSRMRVAGWVYFFYNLLALYFFLTQTCFNGNVLYHRLSLRLLQRCMLWIQKNRKYRKWHLQSMNTFPWDTPHKLYHSGNNQLRSQNLLNLLTLK